MKRSGEVVVNQVVLGVMAVLVLAPVVVFLLTALSPDISGRPALTQLTWGNFVEAWHVADLGRAMGVSLTISVCAVAGQLLLALLGGFAFGVLGVTGEKVLFPVLLLGMMISTEAIIVPLYFQFRDVGLVGTLPGILLIHLGMGVPFGVFWLRAAFRALPRSVFEAAELDGAGPLTTLRLLGAPMVRPAIYTLALLSFMWTWNDYFLSLVFLQGDLQPATVALGSFQGRYTTQINLLAAAGLIVAAPVLGLYVLFQRRFIAGMLAGSIKE
ncbi:carbohydrate ABC transporter membrane protein 2, CUT1 family [Quadrisphaera granulorum]|uniref:Carbohydrate ABC transporter membrane protein 2 (CUT1 family) n=1 Tax=Quadrisphaera granulorum TaxID=317664 RepID=A0A316ACV1_9ACTN|nr:carbohydrate ABC transporter permease [Quadrisphaera granulorum]PWJ47597.1 carbohydrate ABC transporter membrane protein 2 (CUT1 family) [Quadrisphaera granulorum]SZE98727.1 carbohydrate ABC transporter membrane protein 2, CUT1 family [Quadrisphaera granulorum]